MIKLHEYKITCWRQLWYNTQWATDLHALQLPAAETARLPIVTNGRRCCTNGRRRRGHNFLSCLLHLPLEPATGFGASVGVSGKAVSGVCADKNRVSAPAPARPRREPSCSRPMLPAFGAQPAALQGSNPRMLTLRGPRCWRLPAPPQPPPPFPVRAAAPAPGPLRFGQTPPPCAAWGFRV